MGGGCALSREMAFPSCKLSDFRRTSISRDARMKFWPRYAPKVSMGQPGHFPPRPAKTFQKVFAAISDFLRNFSMCHDGKDGGHWVNGLGVGQSRPANLRGAILGSADLPLRPRRSFAESDPSAICPFARGSRATRRFLQPRRYLGRSVAALPTPVVLCLGYSFCGYLFRSSFRRWKLPGTEKRTSSSNILRRP